MTQWTEEEEREARAFAKGFVALMLYAKAQGIMMGFIGPETAILNMEPDQGEQGSNEKGHAAD